MRAGPCNAFAQQAHACRGTAVKGQLHQNFILVANFFFLVYFVLCPGTPQLQPDSEISQGQHNRPPKSICNWFPEGNATAHNELTRMGLEGFPEANANGIAADKHCA